MATQNTQQNQVDCALHQAGLTRADLAKAFGITSQRVGQIVNGYGVSYQLADDLQRYINRRAGKMVCRNEHFIATTRKEERRKKR